MPTHAFACMIGVVSIGNGLATASTCIAFSCPLLPRRRNNAQTKMTSNTMRKLAVIGKKVSKFTT